MNQARFARAACLALVLALPFAAGAKDVRPLHVVVPTKAAVASASPWASEAGMEILAAGGNAFDAAVAVSAALAVTEPTGSGLTGGGIYLLHRGKDNFETAIDAREYAPAAATRDMFLDAQGNPQPGLSRNSALAAGIPGEPAGWALLAARYGKLPVARSLAPAIRLAREGFPLSARLHDAVRGKLAQFAADPEVARNFLRDGAVPAIMRPLPKPKLSVMVPATRLPWRSSTEKLVVCGPCSLAVRPGSSLLAVARSVRSEAARPAA